MSTYETYPAGAMDVRGQAVPVTVDDGGNWIAEFDGTNYSADTKELLRAKLMKLTARKSVRVNVPFTAFHPGSGPGGVYRVRHGSGTGIHQGTGKVLVSWDQGGSDQLSGHAGGVLRRLDAAEAAEWEQLIDAKRQAERALREFEASRKLYLGGAVEKAIQTELGAG